MKRGIKSGLVALLLGFSSLNSSAQDLVDFNATNDGLKLQPRGTFPVNLSLNNDYRVVGDSLDMKDIQFSLAKTFTLPREFFFSTGIDHKIPFIANKDNFSTKYSESYGSISAVKTFDFFKFNSYAGAKYAQNLKVEDSFSSAVIGTSFSPIKDVYLSTYAGHFFGVRKKYEQGYSGVSASIFFKKWRFNIDYNNYLDNIPSAFHSVTVSATPLFDKR
jgi:hypothetical protein